MTGRDDVRNEYAAAAARYDDRWAAYLADTTDRTLRHVALAPGERLLDVGCGTGALLRAAAERFPRASLIGVDLSFPMLGAAGASRARARFVNADAADLPFASASIDVVVTASSLHFWSEPEAGLAEIARVLRPQGRLVVTDWCGDFLTCRLIDRWLRWTGRASYRRIFGASDLEAMLRNAGFEVTAIERYRVGIVWGLMTLAGGPVQPQR